jgi:hypothetical protein
MIKLRNPENAPVLKCFAKDASEIIKNQLIKFGSGADPVAATHTGQTILGVTVEAQATQNGVVYFHPITGRVLEIEFTKAGTKKSFAVTDLGSQYDIVVTSGDQVLDPDDTSGGFLILVDYDNDAGLAYVVVDAADLLLSC